MKQAIIYTRFSPRPNAKECDSCEKQFDRCHAYCQNHGLHIAYFNSDKGITGRVFDRPGLSTVLEQLKPGMVLVVDTVDRLARDLYVNLTIRKQVEEAGATIEYADGSPSGNSPEEIFFQDIMASLATFERNRISFHTKRGLAKRQANGEWFGKPPVGWMRDPENSKKLVECPREQEAVRRAEMYGEWGYTSERIAKSLTELYGLFRGNLWSARTVRKILQNPDPPDSSFCS